MATREFHWSSSYVYTEETGCKTNIIPYESGKEIRFGKSTFVRRTWSLNFTAVNETEKDDMLAFFKFHHGAHNTFLWTNPIDSIQYVARFIGDSFAYQRVTDDVYNISVKLFEVND